MTGSWAMVPVHVAVIVPLERNVAGADSVAGGSSCAAWGWRWLLVWPVYRGRWRGPVAPADRCPAPGVRQPVRRRVGSGASRAYPQPAEVPGLAPGPNRGVPEIATAVGALDRRWPSNQPPSNTNDHQVRKPSPPAAGDQRCTRQRCAPGGAVHCHRHGPARRSRSGRVRVSQLAIRTRAQARAERGRLHRTPAG